MPNPMGRPRTTVADLPAEWESMMREAAQDGASAVGHLLHGRRPRMAWLVRGIAPV